MSFDRIGGFFGNENRVVFNVIGEFMRTFIMLDMVLLVLFGTSILFASENKFNGTTSEIESLCVGPHFIEMPLNRIFLIRKGEKYGAAKITRYWSERGGQSNYAAYNTWFQDDGSTSFLNKNVNYESKMATSKLYGIGRLSFNIGNEEIVCGSFRLWWWGNGMVYFFAKGQEFGDYGIQIAPTKWTEINQVNVSDPRLKWYGYDKGRVKVNMSIDDLW